MDTWINKTIDLMFGPSHTRDTMEQAAILKYDHMPEILYKYRPPSANAISAFREGCLYSSSVRHFNDIFEAPIQLSKRALSEYYAQMYMILRKEYPNLPPFQPTTNTEILSIVKKYLSVDCHNVHSNADETFISLIKNRQARIDELLGNFVNGARNMYNICCFSSSPKERLMWAHYGASSQGFCIGYDIKGLGPYNPMVQLTFPVVYSDRKGLELDSIDDIEPNLNMLILLFKHSDYSYEKEWRTFFLASPEPKKEQMPPAKIVYLGPAIQEDSKKEIIQICSEQNIHVKQLKIDIINDTFTEYSLL